MKALRWKIQTLFMVISVLFMSCEVEKAVIYDGELSLTLAVLDTTGLFNPTDSTRRTPVSGARVILYSGEYNKQFIFYTDKYGLVQATGLLASDYEISAEYPLTVSTTLVGAIKRAVFQSSEKIDTIFVDVAHNSPIVINEVYSSGPVNSSVFFFDQFIEIYNRSDEIQYLDGKIICRGSTSTNNAPFIDQWNYVKCLYAYQFPGKPGEENYPIQPGQFMVIALDALDYSEIIEGAVDLSNADWEFHNQLGSDFDNPLVSNLINVNPMKPKDFLISLITDVVILADGTKFWQDGSYIHVDITTILDGVEYKSSSSTPKFLTRRVDKGYIQGVTRFSGESRERLDPEIDTDNSTLDFRIIDRPTPGYHHKNL